MTKDKELSPGEARTRQRQRRYVIYLTIAGIIGGVIGFSTGFFDQGDGSLFAGDIEDLKFSPGIAIVIVIGLLAGFLVLPLYGFTMIDELKREQNLIAYAGSAMAVIAGFPVWAVLYAGGFAPPPHAFGLFLLALAAMVVSYLYAKFRA